MTIIKKVKKRKITRKAIDSDYRGESAEIRDTRKDLTLPEADLPSDEMIVRIIATNGLSDKDMETMFNLGEGRIDYWRKVFPGFQKAIETGRSMADVNILTTLYKKAMGYDYVETVTYGKWPNTHEVQVVKHMHPDTKALEIWLKARKEGFQQANHLGSGKDNASPIGVRDESKQELISSIMALIPAIDAGDNKEGD